MSKQTTTLETLRVEIDIICGALDILRVQHSSVADIIAIACSEDMNTVIASARRIVREADSCGIRVDGAVKAIEKLTCYR